MKTKYNKKVVFKPIDSNQYFLGGMTGSDWGSLGADVAAGAGTGALTGLAGGPLAPLTSTAGAIIGGGVGLIKGLVGANKSVKGREGQEAIAAQQQQMQLSQQRQAIGNLTGNGRVNLTANGGDLSNPNSPHLREFNNGGSHEASQLGGVHVSFDNQGTPNLVEEGETMKDSFVFSDRLKLVNPEEFDLSKVHKNKTFADVSKELNKQLKERPNDPIAKSTFETMSDRLKDANQASKDSKVIDSINFKCGGKLHADGGELNVGEYDLGDVDLDMEEIDYLKQQGYDVSPIDVNSFADGGETDNDYSMLAKGISQAESAGGVLLKNPQSSASGKYGQLFSELTDTGYTKSRDEFIQSEADQDSVFKTRYETGFNGTPSLKSNMSDVYYEYKDIADANKISKLDIGALSNFLGRQGARKYMGNVLRDGKSIDNVFPHLYGPKAKAKNKTPEEYLKIFRKASK